MKMHAQTVLLALLATIARASPILPGLGLPISLPIPLPTPPVPLPTPPTVTGLPSLPSIPGVTALPVPPLLPPQSPACVSPLFPSPQCCEIDLTVAGLACTSPAGNPDTPALVNAACTAEGKIGRCCLLNVLGIAVLCQDV